jgi:acyl-CoA carboxylase subunit beta
MREGSVIDDWVLCASCRAIVYRRRWARNLRVCPECGLHGALDVGTRLEQLADPGTVDLLDLPQGVCPDVLGFVDTMPYPQRLAQAEAATGLRSAVLCARMAIDGTALVVAAMDFRFMGGSLGALGGGAVVGAAKVALAEHLPLLAVTASGGARMQEGAISLMQMAKTSAAWAELDEAGILTVSLITDPTYGGVAASFATLSDVIIAESGARLGFAGRRVIEQTIRQKLPPSFQTVEFLRDRGFVDMVVPRQSVRAELAMLLRTGPCRNGAGGDGPGRSGADRNGRADPEAGRRAGTGDRQRAADLVIRRPGSLAEAEPWHQVRSARELGRPTTLDYLNLAFDDFVELHGDRASGDCPAMVAGLARLAARPVAVVGHQKGHTPAQLAERNFGMPNPTGYRKAARVMRLAAKLGVPVVTLVDTPGAYPGVEAEEQGQALAIAENLRLMACLPVPVVTVVTGEGGSGGALGIAVANQVLIWENAVYSVISPEGCAAILWKDPLHAPRAATALGLTSRELLRLSVVDGVLPEPEGGVAADPVLAAAHLRAALLSTLAELDGMTGPELITDRRERFARFGEPSSPPAADEAGRAMSRMGTAT